MSTSPIRQYETFEVPVFLEDIGQEIVILAGVVAVYAVVRAHYSRHVGLAYADLEGQEVALAHRALVDVHVHGIASALLIVQGIVLDVADDVLVLGTFDDLSDNFSGEDGVFAHVLEGAAIAGFAGDVHSAAQRHVVALRAQFAADKRSVLMRGFEIPTCRAGHAGGERRGIAPILATHSDSVGGI